MGLKERLEEYKEYVIIAGFIVGGLFIFDILPKTVEIGGLGENVKFVYLAVLGLGLYTFHAFYFGQTTTASFARTVNSRNLSDKGVLRGLQQQRSTGAPPPPRTPPMPEQELPPRVQPSKKVWDTFNRE